MLLGCAITRFVFDYTLIFLVYTKFSRSCNFSGTVFVTLCIGLEKMAEHNIPAMVREELTSTGTPE